MRPNRGLSYSEREKKMSRILKAFTLAMSVMALFAISASAAHAATGALTATEYPAQITGEQGPGATFDIGARHVECATSALNATILGPTARVTFKPIYGGCISNPGALPVTITANGCDYLLRVSKPGTTGIMNQAN